MYWRRDPRPIVLSKTLCLFLVQQEQAETDFFEVLIKDTASGVIMLMWSNGEHEQHRMKQLRSDGLRVRQRDQVGRMRRQ